jgi:ABC-type uncharacterized transport system permease subunit
VIEVYSIKMDIIKKKNYTMMEGAYALTIYKAKIKMPKMVKKIITLSTFPKHIIKKNIRGILTSTLEGF